MEAYKWHHRTEGSAYLTDHTARTEILLLKDSGEWKIAYRGLDGMADNSNGNYHTDPALTPELTLEEAKAVAIVLWRMNRE